MGAIRNKMITKTKYSTKIGDIFSVEIGPKGKKYFQLIAFDLTQLNSDVIRVFKHVYSVDSNPDFLEVLMGDVEFYAHCVTKLGLKMNFWKREYNVSEIGDYTNILFRSSGDSSELKTSNNWWVWKINESQQFVGELKGKNRMAEIGSVIPPDSIVYRMRTGSYDFAYPDF